MKVLYDFQIFSTQTFGGISRVFYELINTGDQKNLYFSDLGIKYTHNFYLHNSQVVKDKFGLEYPQSDAFWSKVNFRGKSKLAKLLKKTNFDTYLDGRKVSEKKLRLGDFDIFHPTYYDPYFLQNLGDKPYVITVPDMIHELYTETLNSDERNRIIEKRKTIEKAAHIIAISENSKKDIIDIYKVDPSNISVVYLSNPLGIKPIDDNFEFPKKFIFYVGHRWAYKNFLLTIQVFEALLKTYPDLYFVCAGGGVFNEEEKQFFRNLNIEDKVLHCGSTDEVIRSGYINATIFIYPSLYEGFGIPILEAMELGCPVVCSDSSCFPEVAGQAAVYFSPKNFGDMFQSVDKLLQNQDIRNKYIEKGYERVKLYSTERMARETQSVYLKVLESRA